MVKKIVCKNCNQLKDYYANDMCKSCYHKIYNKGNPDKCKQQFKKWRNSNQDKHKLNIEKQQDKRVSKGICQSCINPINFNRSIRYCNICLNKMNIRNIKYYHKDNLSFKYRLKITKLRLLNLFWAIYYFISKKRLY